MNTETEQTPNKFCDAIDGFIRRIGHAVSWLNGFLVVVIIVQVILRYVFGRGLVVMEELQWHLYAIAIMIGFSYDVVADSHIRLDLLHDRFSKRRKEIVEIFGIIFLLTPMLIVILIHSWDFLYDSLRINESSDAPMGLCCRWFVKAFIPIGFGMLALAAVSRLVRAVTFLKLGKDA